ncbi:site-specific integrase [Cereibacter sphaeroides]|uniref:tyrosine-type recombinase/integrase n=1 Tax=Cereibacter sphaeroides TaxID=1063 RepID=UPI001F1AF39E|nr:tyrosine-type recombinase/integrase [Cereibacter sphaeroides]MCE6960254.1 site-specific integrase [Cereibacter sphaeroides]MCE6974865.1 site-specific integrase [Cereibacter sphaeroides]
MPSPWKHPNGTFYLRERVPSDIASAFKGRMVTVRVDGTIRTAKLSQTVKVSLETKEPKRAKELYREASADVQEAWQRLRQELADGPVTLTAKQIEGLAGIFYRDFCRQFEDDPGNAVEWDASSDAAHALGETEKGREKMLGSDADRILQEQGLAIDAKSRIRLLEAMHEAYLQAASLQEQRALGDYRPDPQAARFPKWSRKPVEEPRKVVTLTSLFKLWERDHLAEGKAGKTATDFRQKIDSLAKFVGHDDAQRITAKNISEWCEYLRHEQGLSPRTIAMKYLVAIKVIYRLAVEKNEIEVNPAEKARYRFTKQGKHKGEREAGFTDAEARAILTAALTPPEELGKLSDNNKRAIRWGPWICAYTGARVGEVMQLRRKDLEWRHGVPCLVITPEAGSTKTGNFRIVPLHPHLTELGLVKMIEDRPEGPLFFSHSGSDADNKKRAASAATKLGQWVRKSVGITDERVQPNHGWRHRFKTVARDAGMPPEYMDAIQGHEDGRAATAYGEMSVKALYREICKIPRS